MDNVNHPPHYETGKFESINVMEEVFGKESVKDFCLCNAFKYLYRCKHKHDTPLEDVQKAVWYLNRYIDSCVGTYTMPHDMTIIGVNDLSTETGSTEEIKYYDGTTISVSTTGDTATS